MECVPARTMHQNCNCIRHFKTKELKKLFSEKGIIPSSDSTPFSSPNFKAILLYTCEVTSWTPTACAHGRYWVDITHADEVNRLAVAMLC